MKKKKAELKAKQEAFEAAQEAARINKVNMQRWNAWKEISHSNEERAITDCEGEANIRPDMEFRRKHEEWKAWNDSAPAETSDESSDEPVSYAREVYLSSRGRVTVPVGPVATLYMERKKRLRTTAYGNKKGLTSKERKAERERVRNEIARRRKKLVGMDLELI